MTLQPGWRWSECIKPVVGGDSGQLHHVGYLQSGRMHVTHDDGSESEIEAGKAYVIEPGHTPGWSATSPWLPSSSSQRQPRSTPAASSNPAPEAPTRPPVPA